MQTIVLCVGLPGSGKSSTSDLLAKRGNVKANVIHVEDWLDANGEHQMDNYGNHMFKLDTWKNLWRHAKDVADQYSGVLVLDMWLWEPKWRAEVVTALRETFGETRIICWSFITSAKVSRVRYLERQMADKNCLAVMTHHRKLSYLHRRYDRFESGFVPVSDDEIGPIFDDIVIINNEPDRVIG